LELAEVVDSIEEIFKEDPQAQAVIMGDMEGWSVDGVKDLGGMNDQQYAAARKRVRRGLARKFGERGRS
jgi:hypothetical protein